LRSGCLRAEDVLRREVLEAIVDYRYLLNRGYKAKGALNLITSRYLLTKEERLLLYRCVHSEEDAIKIRSKFVNNLAGEKLAIDGYNAIITVAALLEGRTLYLCDDGIVRDLRGAKVRDFSSPSLRQAVGILKEHITEQAPAEVILVLDRSVSMSAEHAKAIRKNAPDWKVILASKTDKQVLALSNGYVVSSSDYVILVNAKRVYDAAGRTALKLKPQQIVDISQLLTKTKKQEQP